MTVKKTNYIITIVSTYEVIKYTLNVLVFLSFSIKAHLQLLLQPRHIMKNGCMANC